MTEIITWPSGIKIFCNAAQPMKDEEFGEEKIKTIFFAALEPGICGIIY
jgi:hypothetical protein